MVSRQRPLRQSKLHLTLLRLILSYLRRELNWIEKIRETFFFLFLSSELFRYYWLATYLILILFYSFHKNHIVKPKNKFIVFHIQIQIKSKNKLSRIPYKENINWYISKKTAYNSSGLTQSQLINPSKNNVIFVKDRTFSTIHHQQKKKYLK